MNPGAALLAFIVLTAPSPRTPISLQTYIARIHVARLTADRAIKSPNHNADLQQAARILRGLSAVRMPGGAVIHTDSAARAAKLLPWGSESSTRDVTWLNVLDVTLQQSRPRNVPASDLMQLDSVLRDSRFHPVRWPWDGLQQWVDSLYGRFVRAVSGVLRPGSPTAIVPAIVLLLLVAAVAFLIARGAMGKLVVERSSDEEYASPTSPVTAGRRAEDLAAEGRYREALRFLFLSTMLQLQEHGLVELRPGLTNREVLHSLLSADSVPGSVAGPLGALVDTFDAVWYGHRAVDVDSYRAAVLHAASVTAAITSRAA